MHNKLDIAQLQEAACFDRADASGGSLKSKMMNTTLP
jgi:hypothetical protein